MLVCQLPQGSHFLSRFSPFDVSSVSPVGKIVLFFLLWGVLWLPIAIPLGVKLKWRPFTPLEPQRKLMLVASLYLLVPWVLWGLAQVQHPAFNLRQVSASYGFPWTVALLSSLAWGWLLAAIGVVILVALQVVLGWVRWQSAGWGRFIKALVPIGLLAGLIGGIEELVFRGFLLSQLLQQGQFWFAAIASSLIFAGLHLIWSGTEEIPQLPGLTLMGIVLCFAVSANSGHLGLAWGLHAGWIWSMASLDSAEMLVYPEEAPVLMVGLGGKPLTGLLGSLLLLATAGVLLTVKGF